MSFITKRERVFNEYDLFDLPARNEGRLKAYASCTDARAWSHFCSDKSEHLVEIIKRNNETCRPKYVPTDVIVNTLMVAKNAEIARLKQRIEEFEQMLAAYDQLELTCDQKCEIANAHAAIKAANKELDDMFFDLDLSNFTEGIDSEAFETGKSRGDEPARYKNDESARSKELEVSFDIEPSRKMETKSNQMGSTPCPCDASTMAVDPRIDELQDMVIAKDAKLSAMQNTIAGLECDVCEPYCIYAHIYTALEKIFSTLCQNQTYKEYLGLLTADKDIRSIDLQGKILFKLKILEKFSLALIAPCSQDVSSPKRDCSCYRADIITNTYALTSAESKKPHLDNKRAHLVADIMDNDEIKEILSKESFNMKFEDERINEHAELDNYCINAENLNRLKKLQQNFDDLMTCYESLKHEKECLQIKCRRYEELEKELETLRTQLMEYNTLWNEKEHYRQRSVDLDMLKEKYLVLTEETSNLESQLKAEAEINNIKSSTIEELRSENVLLEKKLNEAAIVFEKERNALQCKLKESECKMMCQEQQIKSLSLQIDRLLEQDQNKDSTNDRESKTIILLDEIESLKEQIENLKEAHFCNEEEKIRLQEDFENNLQIINELKLEIEDWKSTSGRILQRNQHLENYTESCQEEIQKLTEENKTLSQDVEEKSTAIENLMNVINGKSQELQRVMNEIEKIRDELDNKSTENLNLCAQLYNLRETYNSSITNLENEKSQADISLQLARQESQELLEKVKDYNDIKHKQKEISKSLEIQSEEYNKLKAVLLSTKEENKSLHNNITSCQNSNSILMQEIQRLHEMNNFAVTNIKSLEEEKSKYQNTLEITRKESKVLEVKLVQFDDLSKQFQDLQKAHNNLTEEKIRLENELKVKNLELETAQLSVQLSRKESEELMDKLHKSDYLTQELNKLNRAYGEISNDKQIIQKELLEKKEEIETLREAVNKLKVQNDILVQKADDMRQLQSELAQIKTAYDELLSLKETIQADYSNMNDQVTNLNNIIRNKIEENKELTELIKSLEEKQVITNNNINYLQNENAAVENALDVIKKQNMELISNCKQYNIIENELNNIKIAYDEMKKEKEQLLIKLDAQVADFKRIQYENRELSNENQNLLIHNDDLEQALINARTELMTKSEPIKESRSNLLKEIAELRNERTINQTKIRDLMDKFDQSENNISSLTEEVLARNNKIVILENYINELEDEIRSLHATLDNVVDTGEQIKDYSYQNIEQSLKKMNAHHSRVTYNINMELTKLSNENKLLEEELSRAKMINEKSSEQKDNFFSQIISLQNEREIIVTNIKQLESKAMGDSILSPNNCSLEDILDSIDRIQKSIETNGNKSVCLEQTLLKVQTSSQLLLNKADEAKKIIEEKVLKIITEKEEAIKQKVNVEKQLIELKERLEKQIANDQNIIKDLEAEILNQKLIVDKINDSRHSYISKLEKDMKTLKDLYENSVQKVAELQNQLQIISEEKNDNLDIIKKANYELQEKSKAISILQSELAKLSLKPINNVGIQVLLSEVKLNIESQTDKDIYPGYNNNDYDVSFTNDDMRKRIREINNLQEITSRDIIPRPQSINEVQILTANIEPSFDYVRNCYKNYKLKQLNLCHLECCSISCFSENTENIQTPISNRASNPLSTMQEKDNVEVSSSTLNLVDIYNKHSQHSNSLKLIDDVTKSDILVSNVFSRTNYTSETVSKNDLHNHLSDVLIDTTPHMSVDNNMFVIYRDSTSDNTYTNITHKETDAWSLNKQSESFTRNPTIDSSKNKKYLKQNNDFIIDHNISNTCLKVSDVGEFHLKPKLNIILPKIVNESASVIATSDEYKKSSLSSTITIYSSPKHQSISDTNLNLKPRAIKNLLITSLSNISNDNVLDNDKVSFDSYTIEDNSVKRTVLKRIIDVKSSNENKEDESKDKKGITIPENKRRSQNHLRNEKDDSSSEHQLFRVGAGVLLVKSDEDPVIDKTKDGNIYTPGTFGLNFIINTLERETNPNSGKIYDIPKNLRKTRSVELFDQISIKDKIKSSPSMQSPSKISLVEYNTLSREGKSNDKSQSKSFTEQSIMVKIDTSEEYENKIKDLKKALETNEKDYKKRIEAIKTQYDNNIKCILTEHNQGVNSIQSLHEETLQDFIKIHENEVENLRTMSIEAMKKINKLERENKILKTKIKDTSQLYLDAEPVKMSTSEPKRCRKSREARTLTKTNVEAFNVKPNSSSLGPCTCSLGINISDTIRNIFEQVDAEQRKMAEHTYLKYIANKILTSNNVDTLDAQELSFLHLKVCRTWKTKLSKEEALQKRIDSLENELIYKQRNAQEHISELDRKVAEERRRLQEVREAMCINSPPQSRNANPEPMHRVPLPPPPTANKQLFCRCDSAACSIDVTERRSAGDLAQASIKAVRSKPTREQSNRAVLANLDCIKRREKRPYTDEPPTRLRKSHDRPSRSYKK